MAASAPFRAVEFYSGIGGWSYAAAEAGASVGRCVQVVAAFDVSTVCNDVYASNLGLRPSQRPIERLSLEELDAFQADLWMMSPPCQPHTRQRNNPASEGGARDTEDPRAASFLHLCELLPMLRHPPQAIALENVVGFESSACASTWRASLASAGYAPPREWHLSPTMAGVPNERPRFYALALQRRLGPSLCSAAAAAAPGAISSAWPGALAGAAAVRLRAVDEFLELPQELPARAPYAGARPGVDDEEEAWLAPWRVPADLLAKDAAWCFDIAAPARCRQEPCATACFTHSYGRFARGAGSVLFVPRAGLDGEDDVGEGEDLAEAMVASQGGEALGPDARTTPEGRVFGHCWRERLSRGGELRYFTPREVANILGFPPSSSASGGASGSASGSASGTASGGASGSASGGVCRRGRACEGACVGAACAVEARLPGFTIPDNLPAKRVWAALGNSIHVGTAAAVLCLALPSLALGTAAESGRGADG